MTYSDTHKKPLADDHHGPMAAVSTSECGLCRQGRNRAYGKVAYRSVISCGVEDAETDYEALASTGHNTLR